MAETKQHPSIIIACIALLLSILSLLRVYDPIFFQDRTQSARHISVDIAHEVVSWPGVISARLETVPSCSLVVTVVDEMYIPTTKRAIGERIPASVAGIIEVDVTTKRMENER